MAITTFDGPVGPPLLTPRFCTQVGPALYYRALSDQLLQPNFLYVYEVLLNGVQVAEFRVPPNPAGYGVIDLSGLLRETVRATHRALDSAGVPEGTLSVHVLPFVASQFACRNEQAVKQVTVRVAEHFGDPPTIGPFTSLGHFAISAHRNTLHVPVTNDGTVGGYSPEMTELYGLLTPLRKVFMVKGDVSSISGSPALAVQVSGLSEGVVARLHDRNSTISGGNQGDRTRYTLVTASGTLIQTTITDSVAFGHPSAFATAPEQKLVYEGWYPVNIDSANHPLTPAAKPVNHPNYKEYRIQRFNGFNPCSWHLVFVNSKSRPCKHQPTIIGYENEDGGWQYLFCTGKRRKTADLNRRTYRKPLNNKSTDTQSWQIMDRQDTVFATSMTETYVVDTGSMAKAEGLMLQDLYQSKQVMVKMKGHWWPVVIQGSKAVIFEEHQMKTMNALITFEVATINTR